MLLCQLVQEVGDPERDGIGADIDDVDDPVAGRASAALYRVNGLR